jgi:hypothetical protein
MPNSVKDTFKIYKVCIQWLGVFFYIITENEIEKAIISLKNSKASVLSMIINEMVKYGQLTLTPLLCKLFNLVFSSGIYPKIWSIGYITPFFQHIYQ